MLQLRKFCNSLLYLQITIKSSRYMKSAKNKNVLVKMIEDKKAIQECIRKGGDLEKIAKQRNVKFATPL